MPARFNIQASDSAAIARLRQEFDMPEFIAATLAARGITTPEEAYLFLNPDLDRDWRNPYELPGMRQLIDELSGAMLADKRIVVFGDFDLDGISSTVVLTRALRRLGANVQPFIPNRSDEGYGLSIPAIDRMCEAYDPQCVITVDCGISCREEADELLRRGIQVLITDHHEPGNAVPVGVPLVDPKVDPECPSGILAGVGVALKVVQALGGRFGKPHLWREYTDFATLGTVADLMPMREENRSLVAEGVARMNKAPRPCIQALLDVAGASDKPVAANNLGFTVIPRLNAAGRMGDPMRAFNVLMSDDIDSAMRLAEELEDVNNHRRAIEAELLEMASLQAEEVYHGQRALVLAGEGWHEGVKGIVAGRISQKYGVPTILFAIDENGEAHGSGRVVGEVNLFKAVESCSDILMKFGGHCAAVGVTLMADKLPEFAERLCAYMDSLPADSFHPRVKVDATVRLAELTIPNVCALESLMPFGQENEQPCYLARNVMITNCRAVGIEKNHFSCTLTDGTHSVSAIMFHCHEIEQLMSCTSVVNAAFNVQIDEWRGRRSVKAMLKALSPAAPCAALEACLDAEGLDFVRKLYATDDVELITQEDETSEEANRFEQIAEGNRLAWEQIAQGDPDALKDSLLTAFIGPEGRLHAAQREALGCLLADESVLAIMATGRGKSLVFQLFAAYKALACHETSVFVYPLRALIHDQAYHLNQALAPFGVSSIVLDGDTSPEEREAKVSSLQSGQTDIVLTTPEFLCCHLDIFQKIPKVGFAVVDEAHHVGMSKAGYRLAYKELGEAFKALGSPVVLATTATADATVSADIQQTLGISRIVTDATSRENLLLDDQRNMRNRESYLANLVSRGEKTIIYVNSRAESVALARTLRVQVPQLASLIGFYNAGLSRTERSRIEELFRTNGLCVLVATSAFGEGVNIPDIRHAVLYHMPFNQVEFNQMCGRIGRDGQPATIHLLFGTADRAINQQILYEQTPSRDVMAQIDRLLRARQREMGEDFLDIDFTDIARDVQQSCGSMPVSLASAQCGVSVFRELGLIELSERLSSESACHVHVLKTESKVSLTDSVRYREGLEEIECFNQFCSWVTQATASNLRRMLTSPILPTDGCPVFSFEGRERR